MARKWDLKNSRLGVIIFSLPVHPFLFRAIYVEKTAKFLSSVIRFDRSQLSSTATWIPNNPASSDGRGQYFQMLLRKDEIYNSNTLVVVGTPLSIYHSRPAAANTPPFSHLRLGLLSLRLADQSPANLSNSSPALKC